MTRHIGLWGGLLAAAAWLVAGTTPLHCAGALLSLAVVWWLSEALPAAVTALVVACGAVLMGLVTTKEAFATFSSPPLFLFVGSFFIAEALRIHGIGERMASAMITRANSAYGLLFLTGAVSFAMSGIMSNAASTAIVLPIALAAAAHVPSKQFTAALVLAVAWGASVGGLLTPVGTPPNLIGMKFLETQGLGISFLQWMTAIIPLAIVMFVALMLLLRWRMVGAEVGKTVIGNPLEHQHRPRGKLSPGEWSVIVAVCIAMVGWLLPSVVEALAAGTPAAKWLKARLHEDVVAVLAGCLLFVLPGGRDVESGERRPALLWHEAVQIEWGIILLFGGGMLLGSLSDKTGLSSAIGTNMVAWTGVSATWSIAALVTAVAIVSSELTSNTATATLMAPLSAQLALAAGGDPLPAIMGATLGSSFGFMMPVSTAPNALAYATGKVSIRQMVVNGIIFDVIGFVIILLGLAAVMPLLR